MRCLILTAMLSAWTDGKVNINKSAPSFVSGCLAQVSSCNSVVETGCWTIKLDSAWMFVQEFCMQPFKAPLRVELLMWAFPLGAPVSTTSKTWMWVSSPVSVLDQGLEVWSGPQPLQTWRQTRTNETVPILYSLLLRYCDKTQNTCLIFLRW